MFSVYFGADIEYFIIEKGNIIPAGDILSKINNSLINKDGIQLEINPKPTHCRDNLCYRINTIFRDLDNANVNISNTSTVNIKKSTFDEINDNDKQMGCLPDINVYTMEENRIPGDYKKLRTRTAGGHIHMSNGEEHIKLYLKDKTYKLSLGYDDINIHSLSFEKSKLKDNKLIKDIIYKRIIKKSYFLHEYILPEYPKNIYNCPKWPSKEQEERYSETIKEITNKYIDQIEFKLVQTPGTMTMLNPKITIPMLDLFIAIPSILLDNPAKQIIRRKYYGMAGSFRYTNYGLEYRVLSNFWSFNNTYISLIFGLAREAIRYAHLVLTNEKEAKELIEYLNTNRDKIIHAINNANQGLAKEILNEFLFELYCSKANWEKDPSSVPLGTKEAQPTFKNLVINGINTNNRESSRGFYNYHKGTYNKTKTKTKEIGEQWKS